MKKELTPQNRFSFLEEEFPIEDIKKAAQDVANTFGNTVSLDSFIESIHTILSEKRVGVLEEVAKEVINYFFDGYSVESFSIKIKDYKVEVKLKPPYFNGAKQAKEHIERKLPSDFDVECEIDEQKIIWKIL